MRFALKLATGAVSIEFYADPADSFLKAVLE
jgi:hypothetical protein